MAELDEVLRAAERADERVLAHVSTRASLERALGAVRRRRRRRAVRRGGLAVAGLAAVAAVALVVGRGDLLLDRVPAQVHTPSPTVSTAGPSPSASGTSAPLVVEPNLPPYRLLTADVLAKVGAGWVATEHEPTPFTDTGLRQGPPVVLVASPDGELYRAADVTGAGNELAVERWDAATPTTLVVLNDGKRSLLDLTTGTITPDVRGLPDGPTYVGLAADGREIWSLPGDGTYLVGSTGSAQRVATEAVQAVAPDARHAVLWSQAPPGPKPTLRVVDLITGTHVEVTGFQPPGATRCSVAAWLTNSSLVEQCDSQANATSDGPFDLLATVQLSGSTATATLVRDYTASDERMRAVARVGDGVVAGIGAVGPECDGGVYTWDAAGRTTPVQLQTTFGEDTWDVQAVGTLVYVLARKACTGDVSPATLTVHDLASGASTVLSPLPANPAAVEGLTSFAVAR